MFFDQKKLSPEEIKVKDFEFQNIIIDIKSSDLLLKDFKAYFSVSSPNQREVFKFTYWRWYVELTWRNFNGLVKEDLATVFSQQVPMAILNSYNVLDTLIWYLSFRAIDQQEMEILYSRVKKEFFESAEILGKWKGKDVVVKDLVSELVLLEKRNPSSMEEAEFVSKLKQIMFPKDSMPYILVNPDKGVDVFLETVEFFEKVDKEKIWVMVDMFLYPEKYERSETDYSLSTSEPTEEMEDNKIEEESVSENEQTIIVESQKSLTAEQTPVVEPQARLTTGQVKSQIESEFKKDSEGNFEDIEGVMGRLSELAEENNDPSIAEMIYFDEEGNKFKWKE
jgi:hypothetical protein